MRFFGPSSPNEGLRHQVRVNLKVCAQRDAQRIAAKHANTRGPGLYGRRSFTPTISRLIWLRYGRISMSYRSTWAGIAPVRTNLFGVHFCDRCSRYLVEPRGQRRWQQARARAWRRVAGKFDEGEVITMRKGRSGEISGYKVWMGYEYREEEEDGGIYTLPVSGEFETIDEAERCRKVMAFQPITVRVSPRNPKKSCVFDQDITHLLTTFRRC